MATAKTSAPKAKKAAPEDGKPATASKKKDSEKSDSLKKMTKQAGAKIVTKKAEKSEKLEKHAGKKAAAKEAHEDGAAGKPKKASGAKKAGKHGAAAPLPVTPELRRHMISEMAYYRAESRGFSGGSAHDDWVAAEAVIDRMFSDTLE